MLEQISEWLRLVETGALSERDFYQMVKQAKPAPRPQAAEPVAYIVRHAAPYRRSPRGTVIHADEAASYQRNTLTLKPLYATPQPDRVAELEREVIEHQENTKLAIAIADSFKQQRETLAEERDEARAEVERLRVLALNMVNAYNDPCTSTVGVVRAIDELRDAALAANGEQS